MADGFLAREADITRELIRRGGLHEYVRAFWSAAQPGTQFIDGWYIGASCELATESIVLRKTKRLCINMPPRTGKSTLWSVLAQSYKWTLEDTHKFLVASYELSLCERDAQHILDVINSPLHREVFPDLVMPAQQALKRLRTSAGGTREATAPKRGGGTGRGGQTEVVDDPTKAEDALFKKELDQRERWYTRTMATRIDGDPSDHVRILAMQRLAAGDLSAVCERLGYEMFVLPMGVRNSLGTFVEVMAPERFSVEKVNELAAEMGSEQAISGQLQQNPTPEQGSFIDTEWIPRFSELPSKPGFLRWIQIWDCGFKGKKESHSRVAGVLGFIWDRRLYIWDYWAGRLNYPQTKLKMLEMNADPTWSRAGRILIEDAANGIALLDDLAVPMADVKLEATRRRMAPKLVAKPTGKFSKAERVALESDKIKQGRLLVRDGLEEVMAELTGFPAYSTDDILDCVVHGLSTLDAARLADRGATYRKINAGALAHALRRR